jgi:alpha-L-fucosidase
MPTLAVEALMPWVEGDEVRVVGGNMSGSVVPSRVKWGWGSF